MNYSVFLSYPRPFMKNQENFIEQIKKDLATRGLEPRTLGITDYDVNEPLVAIRRLMTECNGLITIAFKRHYIKMGSSNPNSDIKKKKVALNNMWLTSPYCQIEPAMAFQNGLPILVLREKGVLAEGMLEKGVSGIYLPEFDLDSSINYLDTDEWKQLIIKWECNVRKVIENKGYPPKLY